MEDRLYSLTFYTIGVITVISGITAMLESFLGLIIIILGLIGMFLHGRDIIKK